MSMWRKVRLGEVCDFRGGGTPSRKMPGNFVGDIPWATVKDFDGHILDKTEEYLSTDGLANSTANLIEANTVLVVSRVGLGKIALTTKPMAINQDIKALIPKTECDPRFLLWAMLSQADRIERAGVGATVKGVTLEFLKSIEISLPPLKEQRGIAALFDRAEEIRHRAETIHRKARSIIPALFHEMFGDPVANPKGWDVVELGQVADVSTGITKGRKLKDAIVFQAPYIRVANVQDGRLDLSEVKTIDAIERDLDRYRLEEGDLLMTEGGDPDKLGRCAIWGNEVHNCLHQNHVFRVRMKREKVLPTYAATLIGSAYGKSYFLKVAKRTTGIASINKTQLSAFPVLLPPIAMQQEFDKAADAAKKLENRIAAAEAKSAKVLAAISAEVFA